MFNPSMYGMMMPEQPAGEPSKPKTSLFGPASAGGANHMGNMRSMISQSPAYQQKMASQDAPPSSMQPQFQMTPEMLAGMQAALEGLQGAPRPTLEGNMPMLPPGSPMPQFTKPAMPAMGNLQQSPQAMAAFQDTLARLLGGQGGQR